MTSGVKGNIDGSFGKSGKAKVTFKSDIPALKLKDVVEFRYVTYVFDDSKRMHQMR